MAYIMQLERPTTIDTMNMEMRLTGNRISRSNIYLVLQWLIANQLVNKTVTGHAQWVLYMPDHTKFNLLQTANSSAPALFSTLAALRH